MPIVFKKNCPKKCSLHTNPSTQKAYPRGCGFKVSLDDTARPCLNASKQPNRSIQCWLNGEKVLHCHSSYRKCYLYNISIVLLDLSSVCAMCLWVHTCWEDRRVLGVLYHFLTFIWGRVSPWAQGSHFLAWLEASKSQWFSGRHSLPLDLG